MQAEQLLNLQYFRCFSSVFLIHFSDSNKENKDATLEHVFGRESLSDCGLQSKILEDFCRISPDAVRILERICYSKDQGGYTWA